jgi:hypothetical protein
VTVPEESVIVGNAALLKCSIPSFVADFLLVAGWTDSEGVELSGSGQALGNLVPGRKNVKVPCNVYICLPCSFSLSLSFLKDQYIRDQDRILSHCHLCNFQLWVRPTPATCRQSM